MKLKIERVDQPRAGLSCLTIRSERKNRALLISTLPGALGVGLVDDRPRGDAAIESVSQLRRHLVGGTIERIEMSNRFVQLTISRAEARRFLAYAPRKPAGSWWLSEEDGTVVVRASGARPVLLDESDHFQEQSLAQLELVGLDVLRAHSRAARQQAGRAIERQIKRLRKKREAILGDLERASQAEHLHDSATLILAYAFEIPSHSTHFDVAPWEGDSGPVRIDLDPSKTPAQNADALFRRAKRLKRGLDVAPGRLELVDAELETLSDLRSRVESVPLEDLAETFSALRIDDGPAPLRARKPRGAAVRPPYREFVARGTSSILVGRSAADNDRLTLRIAKPHDLWLHARGVTGAHVVVPLAKGKSCEPETLVDAATLAAHFSDLKGEAIVDVLYTPRRFVHKRKGSAVGAVSLGREKVIAVRVEVARLSRLLASERKP